MTEDPRPELAGPLTALWLTLLALGLFIVALIVNISLFPPVTALGLSQVLAFGSIGYLGAVLHPALEAKELGLSPLARRFVLPVLLLLPSVFLISELDNWIRDWMASSAATGAAPTDHQLPETKLDLLELWISQVALAPVVTEWFFRGVILERLRKHFGTRQAIVGSASLFAVATALPGDQAVDYISGLSGLFLLGLLLGSLRLSAGSILPGILLSAGMQAVAVLSISFGETLAIPGFNAGIAEGTHSPAWLILPSLLCVSVGLLLVRRFRSPDEPEVE
ncbi:MAG: CPBP family intramembrane metalloprotease [Deltaproteobacteria bacterium]|nr:CPBP family intramembrane metalloprotease [Deltaproteobacteria bacterium]